MRALAFLLFIVCAGFATGGMAASDDAITVTDVDGSNDHRIFRVGALTRVLLEPIAWRLVDSEKIDLDWPVTRCLKTPIPPEYDRLTLRSLLAGEAALPDDFPVDGGESPKAALVRGLWEIRTRVDLVFGASHPSDVASALFWVAVSEKLGMTPDELLETYLVKPYGLKDTSLRPLPSRAARMVQAEDLSTASWSLPRVFAGGLLSSPHDILRIAYVMLPHVARSRARLKASTLLCGNEVLYVCGETPDRAAFLGFDVASKRVLLRLSTGGDIDLPELLLQMDGLALP